MRLGSLVIRPSLVPSLITVVVLTILLALGFWQLDRARQKEQIQATFSAHTDLPAVPVTTLDLADSDTRFRRVSAKGRYDASHQILLDNQIQDGRAGFHVLTPLRVPGMKEAILVNRGWVPLGLSRRQLLDVTLTDAEVMISGRIGQPANPGLRLGTMTSEEPIAWPWIVPYVDYAQLEAELGYPLSPAVILLDPQVEDGYSREWRSPFAGFGPERHKGYALQWFSLAATLMVIYLVVNTRRSRDSRE